jgi:hypothetical protein
MIRGPLNGYFETGCEGTIWSLQDERHIDAKGRYSYEGTHHLRDGDHLTVYRKSAELDVEHLIWKGKLFFLDTWACLQHDYLKIYVRHHPYGKASQLCLYGHWIHKIPVNFDLAVWADIFLMDRAQYIGELKPARKRKAEQP